MVGQKIITHISSNNLEVIMHNTSSFKFYATDILEAIGRIYVIVTADYKESSNKLFSEYFIFIESDKKMLGMRYHSEPIEFYDLKIDINFMENQALVGAEGAIDNYVYEKYKDVNSNIHLNQNYSLKKWNWIPLINILKGNTFHKEVSSLNSETKCISLKDFLAKVWNELDDLEFGSNQLFQ